MLAVTSTRRRGSRTYAKTSASTAGTSSCLAAGAGRDEQRVGAAVAGGEADQRDLRGRRRAREPRASWKSA